MMTTEQDRLRQRVIAEAMSQLIPNTNFQEFIGVLREQREVIIDDLCSEHAIKDERVMLATIGELRALKGVIAVYDEYRRRESI